MTTQNSMFCPDWFVKNNEAIFKFHEKFVTD
jgi:hypothetical protein